MVGCNSGNKTSTPTVSNSSNPLSSLISSTSDNHSTHTSTSSSVSISSSNVIDEKENFIKEITEFANKITNEGYQANGQIRNPSHMSNGTIYEIRKNDVTYLKHTYNGITQESLIYFNKDTDTSDWFHLVKYSNQHYFYNEIYDYDDFNIIDADYLLKGIPSGANITKSSTNTYRVSFQTNTLTSSAHNTLTDIFKYDGQNSSEAVLLFFFTESGMRIIANTSDAAGVDINYIGNLDLPLALTSYPTVNLVNMDVAKKYEGKIRPWNGNDALWIKPDWYGFDSTSADKDVFYTPISIE